MLIVDDDFDLVDLLTHALRRAGYSVVSALDREQALHRWEAEHPDLALLDGRRIPTTGRFRSLARVASTLSWVSATA